MNDFEKYFQHLNQISSLGKLYKRYFSSQVLYYQANKFDNDIAEIGCGTGNEILGTYPNRVVGYEINPLAVEFCKRKNLNANLINANKSYPTSDGFFSACILPESVSRLPASPLFF
jgi:SAM-dependent methyltransferase